MVTIKGSGAAGPALPIHGPPRLIGETVAEQSRTILVCSCEDTMPLDLDAVRRGCRGASVESGHQLCRAELERARALLAEGTPVTVACTQEAPLFSEIAAEHADLAFANIREAAGWSKEGHKAGPKMA